MKTKSMQKMGIFNEQHPDSERYPVYGGELFEKRVDAYMRNHKLLRITSKHASYVHKNHTSIGPAQWLKRRLAQKTRRLWVAVDGSRPLQDQ